MTVDPERIKKLNSVLVDAENPPFNVLPWRHGVTENLRGTVKFIEKQSGEFACISKLNNREYVTVPFSLYLKLLASHRNQSSQKD